MSDRDERLATLLLTLGTEPGPSVDLAPTVLARIRALPEPRTSSRRADATILSRLRARRRRWWAVAVVVPALALTACVAIAPVRNALLDAIHLRGVVIRQGPVPAPPAPTASSGVGPGSTPGPGQIGTRTTLGEAEQYTGGRVLVPSSLGSPDEVWRTAGLVNLVYRGGTPLEPRYVITEVTSTNRPMLEKIIRPDSQVTRVDVNGDRAYWIVGLQELVYLDPFGGVHGIDTQLAANSLLWEHRGVTVRLETSGSMAAALTVARSMS
jgi:hypothetical protein